MPPSVTASLLRRVRVRVLASQTVRLDWTTSRPSVSRALSFVLQTLPRSTGPSVVESLLDLAVADVRARNDPAADGGVAVAGRRAADADVAVRPHRPAHSRVTAEVEAVEADDAAAGERRLPGRGRGADLDPPGLPVQRPLGDDRDRPLAGIGCCRRRGGRDSGSCRPQPSRTGSRTSRRPGGCSPRASRRRSRRGTDRSASTGRCSGGTAPAGHPPRRPRRRSCRSRPVRSCGCFRSPRAHRCSPARSRRPRPSGRPGARSRARHGATVARAAGCGRTSPNEDRQRRHRT